jgi:hypothetical protein
MKNVLSHMFSPLLSIHPYSFSHSILSIFSYCLITFIFPLPFSALNHFPSFCSTFTFVSFFLYFPIFSYFPFHISLFNFSISFLFPFSFSKFHVIPLFLIYFFSFFIFSIFQVTHYILSILSFIYSAPNLHNAPNAFYYSLVCNFSNT